MSKINQEVPPSSESAIGSSARPDPEVTSTAHRRRFSAKYKLQILQEFDRCTQRGEIGALLRREGLYSSQLFNWKRQREQGQLSGLSHKRGRKGRVKDSREQRVAELEKENRRLQRKFERVEVVIEVQKKVSSLLGIPLETTESERKL